MPLIGWKIAAGVLGTVVAWEYFNPDTEVTNNYGISPVQLALIVGVGYFVVKKL